MNQITLKELLGNLKRKQMMSQGTFRIATFSPCSHGIQNAALQLFHGEDEAEPRHMQSFIKLTDSGDQMNLNYPNCQSQELSSHPLY